MDGSRIRIARAYDAPAADDGTRVLVDRLWPRGLSKEKAHYDEWLKTVAPTPELRKWYGHDPVRFDEFARRYRAELAEGEPSEGLAHLRDIAARGPLTLLTATKQPEISQAAVLAQVLAE